jgi:hypothetical protein
VSERFKCENPVDANVRALHVDKAGHKMRMYALCKPKFKFKTYLRCVESTYEKQLLARFRMVVLPLRIETRRYDRVMWFWRYEKGFTCGISGIIRGMSVL